MPATAMFSNLKSRVGGGAQPHNPSDSNPISQYFEIGKVVASAGPEHIWKIHDAYRKSDGKVRPTVSVECYVISIVRSELRLYSQLYRVYQTTRPACCSDEMSQRTT